MSIKELYRQFISKHGLSGFVVVFLLVLAMLGNALGQRAASLKTPWVQLPEAEPVRWNPELVKIFALGNISSAVDSLVLKSIQDPSMEHVRIGAHAPMYYHLELATDLDPAFLDAYLFGGVYLSIVRNDTTGSLNLLRKGMSFYSNELPKKSKEFQKRFWYQPWRIMVSLAYVELYDFNHLPAAVKLFRMAAEFPDSPHYLRNIRRKTSEVEGVYDLSIRLTKFLGEVYQQRGNIRKVERQYKSAMIGKSLYLVNRDFLAFREKKPKAKVKTLWTQFKGNRRLADPFGGELFLNTDGEVATRTPYQKIPGMPY